MNKIIAAILIMILSVAMMTGCDGFPNENKVDIEQSIYDEYESMIDAFIGVDEISVVSDYLLQWAQSYQFDARKDRFNNVIVQHPASSGLEDGKPVVIECGISLQDLENDLRPVAIMLTAMKNLKDHNQVTFLFAPYEGRDYVGAKGIAESLLTEIKLINLNTYAPNMVTVSGAESAVYSMSRNIDLVDPSYQIAYEIKINGLTGGYSDIIKSKNPNAIKTLGNFLATCKSGGMLFELASFTGGENIGMYPVAASAIIVINQNDETSLNNRFEKALKSFQDNYSESQPQFSYTLTQIGRPQKVLSHADSDHIVSFLYTLFNGIYAKSETENTVAISNLGMISTSESNFEAFLTMRSLDPAILLTMQSDLSVICNLNEFSYSMISGNAGWRQLPGKSLAKEFSEITGVKTAGYFNESQCAVYQDRNRDIEIISYGVDLVDCEKQCNNLIQYIETTTLSEAPAQ